MTASMSFTEKYRRRVLRRIKPIGMVTCVHERDEQRLCRLLDVFGQ